MAGLKVFVVVVVVVLVRNLLHELFAQAKIKGVPVRRADAAMCSLLNAGKGTPFKESASESDGAHHLL